NSRVDERNGEGNHSAAGLDDRRGDRAEQHAMHRVSGQPSQPLLQRVDADGLDLARESLQPIQKQTNRGECDEEEVYTRHDRLLYDLGPVPRKRSNAHSRARSFLMLSNSARRFLLTAGYSRFSFARL